MLEGIKIPKSVLAVVSRATEKYSGDIRKASKVAEAAVRKLPEFDVFVNILIRKAIQTLVYEHRHRVTTAVKRQAGQYGPPAKAPVGKSKAVNDSYKSILFSIMIGGTSLGMLRGKDLPVLAEEERRSGNGHLANSLLLSRLAPLVKGDSLVKDSVSGRKVEAIWDQAKRELGIADANAA